MTRQGYIGKEKDIESSLGDHGVRKYDYETGRFNSIDPLWEKYLGWTPYQYCRNDPISRVDFNGMDDGSFGNFISYGPILKQEVKKDGQDLVTVQDIVKYSDKPQNKQLIDTWAEAGLMGLTSIATEAIALTKAAKAVGGWLKDLAGISEDAVKGGSKAVELGDYTITKTVEKNLATRSYINSPSTITNIMKSGKGVPDAYFKGGVNYKVPGTFNKSNGQFELGINPKTNQIYHFLFKTNK